MKKDEANAAKKKPKTSAAQIRVQKGTHFLSVALLRPYRPRRIDLSELELPSTMKTDFPDAADLLNFTLTISPDEGRSLASACGALRNPRRHVQGRRLCLLLQHQHQLPARPAKGQMHPEGPRGPVSSASDLTPAYAQIYHPNVDLEGNVCLNILREDWKPVLNLNSVMVGLQYLFLEPNADDPLNKGASGCCTSAVLIDGLGACRGG
jgi:ubiquitin-conjugating enzyme E2 M